MSQRDHTDSRDRPIDSEFYRPAEMGPSSIAGRFGRTWAALFTHHVVPRKYCSDV